MVLLNCNQVRFSTDGGDRNWTQVVSVNKGQTLTFGAGFDVYPAVYIFGQLGTSSKDHFYRSDDAGQSWIRINEQVKKKFGAASELLPVTEISLVDFMQLQVAKGLSSVGLRTTYPPLT